MTRVLGCLLFFLVFAQFAWSLPKSKEEAPSEELCFGAACLHLGMKENDALAILAQDYDVKKISEDKSDTGYLLTDKEDNTRLLLNLSATDGKLDYIAKDWSPAENTAPAMLQAIYSLASQIAGSQKLPCTVEARSTKQTDADTKAVFLTCGARYIRMELITVQGEPGIQLQEVLQASDFGR